jgi:hypothetical protein
VGIAKSFGLLQLPKMPELKSVNRDEWTDADVDVSVFSCCVGVVLTITPVEQLCLCRQGQRGEKGKHVSGWHQ